MISSFFKSYSVKKRIVKSFKLFPANIKSINPKQKYLHIIECYGCILFPVFFLHVFISNKHFNVFWNFCISKLVKG